MATVSRNFDSLAEFVDYCDGDTDFRGFRLSRANRSDFHGCESFETASRLAFNWPEGVARIERIRARVALKSQRTRKSVHMREAGPGVISMGHYMAGHPQPFAVLEDDSRKAQGKGKVVRVLLNCCVSAGISTETIETRGAALLALVSALEQAGRRVEVVVGFADGGSHKSRIEYRVTVKRAQSKLNLNSVAFAVAHPDMLRRFVFAAMEREEGKIRERHSVGGGYGRVEDFTDVPAETIHMPSALWGDRQWDSEEGTARWINETLEAQGVTVKR